MSSVSDCSIIPADIQEEIVVGCQRHTPILQLALLAIWMEEFAKYHTQQFWWEVSELHDLLPVPGRF
jgi:hypothetical protein